MPRRKKVIEIPCIYAQCSDSERVWWYCYNGTDRQIIQLITGPARWAWHRANAWVAQEPMRNDEYHLTRKICGVLQGQPYIMCHLRWATEGRKW